eukprot:g3703.t1
MFRTLLLFSLAFYSVVCASNDDNCSQLVSAFLDRRFPPSLHESIEKTSNYTGDNFVFFLHVPRTAGRTFWSCFLFRAFPPSKRCAKSYDLLRLGLSRPDCQLLASHDDYSITDFLPPGFQVITQARYPVDRVISAYEFTVLSTAREFTPNMTKPPDSSEKVKTRDVWPWIYLIQLFDRFTEASVVRLFTRYKEYQKKFPKEADEKLDRWIRTLSSKSGKVYYFHRRTRESKWTLDEEERKLLMPSIDPYNNSLILPLDSFLEFPMADELVHNAMTYQVLGLSNLSYWPEAHEIRKCAPDSKQAQEKLLEAAKLQMNKMLHISLTSQLDESLRSIAATLKLGLKNQTYSGQAPMLSSENKTETQLTFEETRGYLEEVPDEDLLALLEKYGNKLQKSRNLARSRRRSKLSKSDFLPIWDESVAVMEIVKEIQVEVLNRRKDKGFSFASYPERPDDESKVVKVPLWRSYKRCVNNTMRGARLGKIKTMSNLALPDERRPHFTPEARKRISQVTIDRIKEKNWMDMELYEYSKKLYEDYFERQRNNGLLEEIPKANPNQTEELPPKPPRPMIHDELSADRSSRHLSYVDEAYWIGASSSSESYLNRQKIIQVAKECKVTAIHPGYGFLSEDAVFANYCQEAGIKFVGPPAAAIQSMGDKSRAKTIMREAGVPVVPGYEGPDQSVESLMEQGDLIGYPLLVKAIMGGGGKGMKQANNKDELKDAILSAQREALASFGDSRVLLEKFIEHPRHIEVQILADHFGNVLHLFERDCSIQRRHQKIIEESPAPFLTQEFRHSIYSSAISAAKAVGYQNAGTVEFILDTQTNDFYFMEMNTRLQVEHPVSEWVCGLDLVELQLLVASGKPLPITQDEIVPRGHSIEARVYAELPHQNFMPGTGILQKWKLPPNAKEFELPQSVKGVRVDSGVKQGDEIGVFYDPMIAKIISGGKNREEAINQLQDALCEIQVGGLSTNIEFLNKVVDHRAFREANLTTKFIANHPELLSPAEISPELIGLTSLVQRLLIQQRDSKTDPKSPWSAPGYKRLNHDHIQTLKFSTIEGVEHTVRIRSSIDGTITTEDAKNEKQTTISHLSIRNGEFQAQVNGASVSGDCLLFDRVHDHGVSIWSKLGTCTLYWKKLNFFTENVVSGQGSGIVMSPMPGRITKVLVKKGDLVQEGQVLVLMEAMKMEHMIKAPIAGEILSVSVHTGTNVNEGKTILEIKSPFPCD